MNDNPYSVTLLPDEFHELLSKYENYVKWWHKDMPPQQLELSGRVLDKLHKADATHICLDEFQAGERTHASLGKTVSGRKYLTDWQ